MGLELVEFVLSLEEEFGFPIDEMDAEKIQTVGELVEYLGRKTGLGFVKDVRVGGRYIPLTEERLLEEVIRILESVVGKIDKVELGSRFIEDLGMG